MNTFEKVKSIFFNKGFDVDELTDQTTWQELGCDSLDRLEIINELEKEYEISIPDEALPIITNIGLLVSFIDEMTTPGL